jgi:hypothetical protein
MEDERRGDLGERYRILIGQTGRAWWEIINTRKAQAINWQQQRRVGEK